MRRATRVAFAFVLVCLLMLTVLSATAVAVMPEGLPRGVANSIE
jgi:hypothetical protein